LYNTVVLPAASRPSIKIRFSTARVLNILAKKRPIYVIDLLEGIDDRPNEGMMMAFHEEDRSINK
jgi:hypothetical protein